MYRISMPFYNGADLKFEHLDPDSIKAIITDLKKGLTVHSLGKSVHWDKILPDQRHILEKFFKLHQRPPSILYYYNREKNTIEKLPNAKKVTQAFLKLASYDRDQLVPGYVGKFVIHNHQAKKAGHHFDLRLEFPVASLHEALNTYEGKRLPGTPEPLSEFPDKPGTVYRSFAVRKHTLPTEKNKLFIVETEDHPVQYGTFKGTIPEGYGAGDVDIFDRGTFKLIDVEGDKKYTIEFKGKELRGIYAFVKYKNGYLWVKTKK